jgi:hypothetical protein
MLQWVLNHNTYALSSLRAWHTVNAEDKQSSIMPIETTYRMIRIFSHKCISHILPFTQRVPLYPSKSIIPVKKKPNTLNFILGLIGLKTCDIDQTYLFC